jgi:hypothetical protein
VLEYWVETKIASIPSNQERANGIMDYGPGLVLSFQLVVVRRT